MGLGEVEIELGGKTETLRSTLKAAKQVNGGGGFINVLGRLAAMDQDFYVMVVAAGLDRKIVDVEQKVFDAGLPNLTEPLSTFVQYLANGGKPITASDGDGTGEA
jgi:hypothetical protein